jgi:hypothetical protein
MRSAATGMHHIPQNLKLIHKEQIRPLSKTAVSYVEDVGMIKDNIHGNIVAALLIADIKAYLTVRVTKVFASC